MGHVHRVELLILTENSRELSHLLMRRPNTTAFFFIVASIVRRHTSISWSRWIISLQCLLVEDFVDIAVKEWVPNELIIVLVNC